MDTYSTPYLLIAVFVLVALVFPLLPLTIARLVSPKKPSATKQDTYECGLPSSGDAWVNLKVQYYIYALAFVAFDLEAPFVYAWATVFRDLPVIVFLEMLVFLAVLGAGLVYAWRKRVLEWK